jgi:flavin-dependent dehydrogenase
VIRAGYGWSFPAADELRVGVGSFDPHDHVKRPTVALADELGLPPEGYQGNWIPHKLRPAVEDGVFFAGDSAGHCLPLTAEGIRTAFYFGIACGRELRAVLEGRRSRAEALERYGRFSESHRWKFELMLRGQQAVPRLHPRALGAVTRAFDRAAVSHWAFGHYLRIAPPEFALPAPPLARSRPQLSRAA